MTTVVHRSRIGSLTLAGMLAAVLVASGLTAPARAAIPLPHEDPFGPRSRCRTRTRSTGTTAQRRSPKCRRAPCSRPDR